ncbi:hypothetical protein AB0D10_00680 [Kitasatospora sp. NPDC048545]|uniref:hypothetical protein n=1 Tax=Kitasatospora sp. NPDC048545 TaxID=3157208 RepID=UPI0033CBCB78
MAVSSEGVLRALAEMRRAGVDRRADGGSPLAALADAADAFALMHRDGDQLPGPVGSERASTAGIPADSGSR